MILLATTIADSLSRPSSQPYVSPHLPTHKQQPKMSQSAESFASFAWPWRVVWALGWTGTPGPLFDILQPWARLLSTATNQLLSRTYCVLSALQPGCVSMLEIPVAFARIRGLWQSHRPRPRRQRRQRRGDRSSTKSPASGQAKIRNSIGGFAHHSRSACQCRFKSSKQHHAAKRQSHSTRSTHA